MSALGSLLERHADALMVRWSDRLQHGRTHETAALPELRDHVPQLLRELRVALRDGRTAESSAAALDHGNQRQSSGFDVEAVVREYDLLINVILDAAEEERVALSITEVRIVTEFVSKAVGEGIAAHRRHHDNARVRREEATLQQQRRADAADLRLASLFRNAPAFMAALHGPTHVFTLANEPYQRLVGVGRPLLGLSVAEALPEVLPQGFIDVLDRVYRTNTPHFGTETAVCLHRGDDGPEDAYVNFTYQPTHNAAGEAAGIDVFGFDVTEQVRARQRVESLMTELRAREVEREQLLATERAASREAEVQRAHLRALVATAPIGVATWRGPQHRFESANDLYLCALRRAPTEIGRPLAEVFPELPADHPLFAAYDNVYRTGQPFVAPEYRLTLTIDGRPRERIYIFHLNALRDADGGVDGVIAYASDVTETVRSRELVEVERDHANAVAAVEVNSRQVSEQARARTEFLLAVASALSEGLDLDVLLQRLVDVIAASQSTFASVWSVVPGEPLRRRVHAPFNPRLASAPVSATERDPTALPVERVIVTGETLRLDDYATWMSAERHPEVGRSMAAIGVRAALFVPIRRGSTIVAVLAVASGQDAFVDQDVEVFESVARSAALAFESARLFAEMVRLRAVAEQATVAKDHFLAHVSHDLRNPLNSILGWSGLLRGIKDAPVQLARGLDVIERNAKAQVQLIDDLLDVSRIASGKLSLDLAVEDVRAAIDVALDAPRLAAAAKNVSLVVIVDDAIGAITVDPDRFRQIIWNLASNAVKFTPSGGTVRVSAQRVASTFHLVVADDGRGIAPAFLSRVFTSFEQMEAGRQRSGGLGLGLSIVRHLVELHGGSVKVESEGEGKGARFSVELPIRAAVRPSILPVESGAPRVLEGVRVLVVDDEEDAREVVAAILEHAGASVTTAPSADDALASLVLARPDAIVSDIGMPWKDGKTFVREVRSLSEAQGGRIPAVALTAFVRAKDRVEILSAGFTAHVAKPVEPTELVLTVAGLVGRPSGVGG